MPKFIVTNSSYFQPFTYDELARPVMESAEMQRASQDAYDAINLETEALRNYITDNPGDARAKEMYDNYVSQLNSLQENLWNRGYNAQTRRDLAKARAGYAGDISRLSTAIKNRQERSAAYWDARHKNPDLVMGADPASFGLDSYLGNDSFGQDWYSYNGKEFEAGVAAETKARANELLKSSIGKDPELAGYLTRVMQKGFTNGETLLAGDLVDALIDSGENERKDFYQNHNISAPVQILAETLINKYNSTGAREANISDSERQRLLNYGKSGWAHGILDPDIKDFTDKVYDEQEAYRKMNYQHSLTIAAQDHASRLRREEAAAKNNGQNTGSGVTMMGGTVSLRSPGYDDFVKATASEAKNYSDGKTQTIVLPDGRSSKTISNEYEMAEQIYSTKAREDIRRALGGYDIALDPKKNKEFTVKTKDGQSVTYSASRPSAEEATRLGIDRSSGVVFKDKKTGELNPLLSQQVSGATQELNNQIQSYKDLNPGIEKMAVSPEAQAKLREKNGYPANRPWRDFYPYMLTKETVGDFSPAILVGDDTAHDYVRANLANEFIGQYNRAADKDGKIGKGSRFAIHKVNNGGMSFGKEAQDIGEVLGKTKEGAIRTDTMLGIYATLEDFASPTKHLRFQSAIRPGEEFETQPIGFGPFAENTMNNSGRVVAYIMAPILNPSEAMNMSQRDAIAWGYESYRLLGSNPDNFPLVRTQSGEWRPITPMELIRNPEYQEAVRNAVRSEIADPALAKIREAIGLDHEQHKGDTNAKAEEYF